MSHSISLRRPSILVIVCIVLLSWSSTTWVQCQQNPTISFITKERITNIGDTLDISCSVQYAKNYPVIWAKIDPNNPSNILFISKGASLSIPDNRYSIRHDYASSTYTLQISKIQEIDAGIYQCQVVISTSSRATASEWSLSFGMSGMKFTNFQFLSFLQTSTCTFEYRP